MLTYDVLSSTPLTITQALEAEGPHQYLSLGISTHSTQTVYATTWGQPSALSSWHVNPTDHTLTFGNRALITATGSYVHTQPPPYLSLTAPGFGSTPGVARWLGSAGGPTGELHALDPETGRIGEKVKELTFLAGGEAELEGADKSRKALRYGAHSFDCSASTSLGGGEQEQVAFVADLGSNSVKAYTFPSLEYLYEVKSKRDGDGPRHSIPHPHLPLLFTVTEHTSYVDVYRIPLPGAKSPVDWLMSADMLLPHQAIQRAEYRGDTLRFSTSLTHVFATTRGKTAATKGLLIAYRLETHESHGDGVRAHLKEVARFETRTSGGKANAIELAPHTEQDDTDLLILTDDEQGWLDVVAFNPTTETFTVQATTKLPPLQNGEPQGASHAIWLLD